MDDVRVVMDAAGSERAALFGISEGGPMSVLFAATYPERTSALILYGSIAKGSWAPDYPWGTKPDANWEKWLESFRKEWGGPIGIEHWGPSVAHDERFRQWWAKYLRLGASPNAVISLWRMNHQIDVRAILPAIHVPTLVLHRSGDRAVAVEEGRYLAEHIPGARFVELAGDDHLWWVGDSESIVNEIEEFLTGERHAPEPDRVLVTILFTDIVASTQRAAEMGDHRWRDLLDRHNAVMQAEIDRFRGRVVKNTGDGYLATFDGPARAIHCACAASGKCGGWASRSARPAHRRSRAYRQRCRRHHRSHCGAGSGGAKANEVWTSRTVKDLVAGSRFKFSERGTYTLKGVSGDWPLFTVEP